MTTYYVDPAVGNDNNNGLAEGAGNAWATPGKAADTVVAGDVVYLKASATYTEAHASNDAILSLSTSGTADSQIKFEGYTTTPGDGGRVTFDCNDQSLSWGVNCGNTSYQILRNIIVDRSSSHSFLSNNTTRILFITCHAQQAGFIGFHGGTYSGWHYCSAVNGANHGFQLAQQAVVVGCFSRQNAQRGFQQHSGSFVFSKSANNVAGELFFNGNLSCIVANSVFDAHGRATRLIDFFGNQHVRLCQNNILTRGSVGIYSGNTAGEFTRCLGNLFHQVTTKYTNVPADPEEIDADPLFVDPANYDYRIAQNSPARQSGFDAAIMHGRPSFIDRGAEQAEDQGGGGGGGWRSRVQGGVQV